ncbi:MAG: hypothetical protein KAS32_21060 [Candidatus Peribacteraceae bacterium]|nr:hypothetical protein [Candidatus Peribacteraceae bacterium]
MNWYFFKNKKVQGYCPAKNEREVARFADQPISELRVERVVWNDEEFIKS